jgi:hypothetical protein
MPITAKQESYLVALLATGQQTLAAKSVKVSRETARKWMIEPEMRQAYRDMRKRASDDAFALLQENTVLAVQTLIEVMQNGESDSVRITAARTILEHAKRQDEMDIEARIEELERLMNEKKS